VTKPDYPSDEEIGTAVDVIHRLPRGYLPYPLFIAITAKIVTPTLELAIIDGGSGKLQVLLVKRPDDDLYWPGQWHVPGTVIRSTDTEGGFNSCFTRILDEELSGLVTINQPKRTSIEFWEVERGRELDQLFYSELISSQKLSENIQFFPFDRLPKNLMRHHREVLHKIKQGYTKDISKN
jgi:hypothetical protein